MTLKKLCFELWKLSGIEGNCEARSRSVVGRLVWACENTPEEIWFVLLEKLKRLRQASSGIQRILRSLIAPLVLGGFKELIVYPAREEGEKPIGITFGDPIQLKQTDLSGLRIEDTRLYDCVERLRVLPERLQYVINGLLAIYLSRCWEQGKPFTDPPPALFPWGRYQPTYMLTPHGAFQVSACQMEKGLFIEPIGMVQGVDARNPVPSQRQTKPSTRRKRHT